tara:strand:+ start:48 stop:854 length:807 start_codon:yes stop_codon:yes gene_type:complete
LKKIYYLVGLPRAGNTLFGSILNQNPRVRVTANSIVSEIMWLTECLKKDEVYQNFPDEKSLDNVIKNIISNYYKDWDCDIVLDRSSWGLQDNLEMLKKYAPNEIKFVVLYRDIQEVVASFIHWSENNKPNFLDNSTDGTYESKAAHMMRTDSEIWRDYWSIKGAKDSGFPCFFIEYKDLVTHTPDVISSLYEFLEIDSYDHDYEKLNLFNIDGIKYDDTLVGSNLHTIRTNGIQFNKYNLDKYLSKDILNICRTLNFWKDGSLRKTWC